jgi:hypothetical protein
LKNKENDNGRKQLPNMQPFSRWMQVLLSAVYIWFSCALVWGRAQSEYIFSVPSIRICPNKYVYISLFKMMVMDHIA